jgi:mono/diheme cytochrome c family protein
MSDQQPRDAEERREDSRHTLEIGQFPDDQLHDVHAQLMREKMEPTVGFSPMPIFLIFLFGFLVFFCGIYVAHFSAGFSPMVYNEHVDPRGPREIKALPAPDGEKVYQRTCQACHQANGMGIAGSFPPLVQSEWVLGSEERMIAIVLNGLQGPIEVKGETYNNVMTPLAILKDAEIAAVLTYVRSNEGWGNDAAAVTADQVKSVRSEHARAGAMTAPELLKLFP